MTYAHTIRDAIAAAEAGTFIRVADLLRTGASRPAVESTLSRLARNGDLVRVRKGLYWRSLRSRFGPGRPRPLDVAMQVLDDPAGTGPCGWYASHALGLSSQVPPTPELAILGPPPTGVPGVRFRTRRNPARRRLQPLEIALLEVLRDFPRFTEVSWSGLVDRVRALGLELDVATVVDVARHERRPALRANAERLAVDLNLPPDSEDLDTSAP